MSDETRVDPGEWDRILDDCDGYQLIVAGPGTGKTEFLVRRVARIVETGKAPRDGVLVLTFSRRAARSIGDRIAHHLGESTMPVEATTFHSLALGVLESATGRASPTPLTTPEQVATVRDLLGSEDESNWPVTYRGILGTPGFAEEVADFVLRCSERLLTPTDLGAMARERADWRGLPGFYERYLKHLEKAGRVDYGSLLVQAVAQLEGGANGARNGLGYSYVLVDEYQDTSPAQARISDLLSAPSGNLTVTGDPYQSIYSFRGAELRNIDEFLRRHDGKRIVLGRSFRVPEEILSSALRIVRAGDLPGAAGPVESAPHQGRVECYIFDQETAEAEWIAGQVDRAIRVEGIDPGSIAILMRSKQEMLNEMSRALARRRIPHDRPDRRLIDHPAVRLIADLVEIAATEGVSRSGSDSVFETEGADAAARRLLLGPLVGLSLGAQRGLTSLRRQGRPWREVFATTEFLTDFGVLLGDVDWATTMPAIDGFWHVWTSLPHFGEIVAHPDRANWRRAYSSFAQVLDRQADRDPGLTLAGFFEVAEDESFEATPLITHTNDGPAVALTTLHQAKGLEFDVVFIANAVEGVFPDLRRSRRMLRPELLSPERTTDASAVSAFQIQEEMRLAYTAMTRARSRVVWTATDAGVDQGERRPSRFLLAASGNTTLEGLGSPRQEELEPVSLAEAEIALRRIAADPIAPAPARTAAVSILARSSRGAWEARYFRGVAPPGPDKPILGSVFSMSPSQADGYTRCPRRYAVERRLRLGDPTSPYMTTGSLIHKALELAEGKLIGAGVSHGDVDDALAALRSQWEAADFGSGPLNRAWLARAEKIVRSLYEKWPASSSPAVKLEQEVEMEIDGVTWFGVIDRLEESARGHRVVDYKTGTQYPTVDEAAVSIQLGFYALAVNAEEGPNVVAAELWYPATSAKSLTIRKLDLGRLDEVEQAMRDITRLVASEDWRPRVSSACNRCAIKSSCPAWPEGRGAYLS